MHTNCDQLWVKVSKQISEQANEQAVSFSEGCRYHFLSFVSLRLYYDTWILVVRNDMKSPRWALGHLLTRPPVMISHLLAPHCLLWSCTQLRSSVRSLTHLLLHTWEIIEVFICYLRWFPVISTQHAICRRQNSRWKSEKNMIKIWSSLQLRIRYA